MTENDLAKLVVDCAFKVHTTLGPGLLESVYETVLAHEVQRRGLRVQRQAPITITYDDLQLDEAFRADLIIEDRLIVEIKSTESTPPVHKKQLLTYLRLSGRKLGLLINFGAPRIKDGITRIVNGLDA
ncbi:GxxExxY protein [Myxococcota bacterium]|jgi:GxxExxY protein|nr:GxxExxY protein [Myxococcota bacterium]